MIAAGLDAKQKLLALSALLVILGSALWIYRTQFSPSNLNIPLHQTVGQVMAEETSRLVGHTGGVVIVTADTSHAPELKVRVEAFEKQLKRLGCAPVKDK